MCVCAQVRRALDAVIAKFGRLTTLVNCAGIAPPARVLGKKGVHPLSQFQKVPTLCVIPPPVAVCVPSRCWCWCCGLRMYSTGICVPQGGSGDACVVIDESACRVLCTLRS